MLSLGQSRGSDRGLRNIDALLKKFETMSDPPREEASGAFMSGGGGLVGTVADYCAFCECMRNGGRPILSPRAVRFMMTNHLGTPDTPDRDLSKMQRTLPFYDDKSYTEMGMPGTGFGLGFAVTMREGSCPYMVSNGSASWGGAASTLFWIDRKERLTVVFATQFRFRDDLRMPLRATLSNLVYGACPSRKCFLAVVRRKYSLRINLRARLIIHAHGRVRRDPNQPASVAVRGAPSQSLFLRVPTRGESK